MKRLSYIFTLFALSIYSQKTIKDATSQETISHVEIYSNEGDLMGTTDINGNISTDITNSINSSKARVITFSHPLYEKKELSVKEFTSTETILLNTAVYVELKEVIVRPKSNYKYLKLTGYFRSVQLNNDRPHYVIEGIAEYYISLKTYKTKVKIVSNRSFENKNIQQLDEKGAMQFSFLLAGCPDLEEKLSFKNLIKQYEVDSLLYIIKDTKTKKVIGHIGTFKDLSNVEMDLIAPDNPKIMGAFGMESIFKMYSISAYYNTKEKKNIDLENIVYFKENREYEIRASKKDAYAKVDTSHELYLISTEYVSEKPKGKFDNCYDFKTPSAYKENFWEKIESTVYQPFPNTLEKYIAENMVEVKK